MTMEKTFRLFDFNVFNGKPDESSNDGDRNVYTYQETSIFQIQMFGIDEKGDTCSITVTNFQPFFYVLVEDHWDVPLKNQFIIEIKKKIGKFYEKCICEKQCIMVKRKKLYGFDAGKEYKFIKLVFTSMNAFNKTKNLWYSDYNNGRKLLKEGFQFNNNKTELYEANIPPLLRFFHIKDISPSGWIALPMKKIQEKRILEVVGGGKSTTCTYEYILNDFKDIIPLNDIEKLVPYKICSFDIEASSSHGDFPIPVKSYKKLASNIVDYFETLVMEITPILCKNILKRILFSAFGFDKMVQIDIVYPKKSISKIELEEIIEKWTSIKCKSTSKNIENLYSIENLFHKIEEDEEEEDKWKHHQKTVISQNYTIIDIICDKKISRDEKINQINASLTPLKYSSKSALFPELEGDKVTFIGSTFIKYGETEPYLNHCIALNTCRQLETENTIIESYNSEKEVLLAWQKLIQKENPDIIIGYNIFGFDYQFMFKRAQELDCVEAFLQLSRNKEEICGNKIKDVNGNEEFKIEESNIQIASGQHELRFIKMNGRLQIDLYNYFRREENLTSYKLDYVAGHFIGDYIKSCKNGVVIKTSNLTGLLEDSFIHLEEIGHSVDYYDNGSKFKVLNINWKEKEFTIDRSIIFDENKKMRWCLAKDDVTPKDIFRMTNGTAEDRATIAKYCIQDCNLVQNLMKKVDIITGFVEMAKICSVPISFLVMRGQGIKLTSYIAKKCREKQTLMPVLEKEENDDGYEGAIVLDPKCDLYLDNPVACVDYASLYPSSMISENLSHDSKVWTKEYDLEGNLMKETGIKNENGDFIYDNLLGHEYVNITYDTYKYVRKTPSSSAEKIKSGKKICRFEQTKAIMPSILEELLSARKATRKLIPQQTDEFMKNVLDKRQLGYKVTANSLYGQCGATTSTFYEKDVAASTTATGRMLLTYAKRIVEETYGNRICDTEKYGPVLTKAEYIYGDSVANYTPVYVRVNKIIIDILTIENLGEKYGKNKWTSCIEPGKQEKEVCELNNVETWTEKGWSPLYRIIRHKLASDKKMIRILTHNGLVDVTDDHSLLYKDGTEVSPKDVDIGNEILHRELLEKINAIDYQSSYKPKLYRIFSLNNWLDASMYINFLNCNYCKFNLDIDIENNKLIVILLSYKTFNEIYKNLIHQIITKYEIPYDGYVYDLTTENHHFAAGIGNMIVHNTDSVFFTFNLQTPEGEPIRGKEALEITIELAQEAGHLASRFLKKPHDLEYEKTFMPFCLLSKKRYVGMLYEHDPNKGKRKEMGIVLKRRDNAPIVKDIYGGIIDILMKEKDIQKAIDFLRNALQDMVDEKYPMDKLIITKSLRSGYKNPNSIAHKVLADRITTRDPGNKPSSGDRIPFVYIHNKNKKSLQGEKIETPTYIKENNLKIDYSFYITNQIMKPVQQVFALVLEKIWEMQGKKKLLSKFKKDVEKLKSSTPENKWEDKLEQLKNKEVKNMLFEEYLRETNNEKEGNQSMLKFFTKK
jgi:DNA polymerase elongation subunit (family B)